MLTSTSLKSKEMDKRRQKASLKEIQLSDQDITNFQNIIQNLTAKSSTENNTKKEVFCPLCQKSFEKFYKIVCHMCEDHFYEDLCQNIPKTSLTGPIYKCDIIVCKFEFHNKKELGMVSKDNEKQFLVTNFHQ